MLPIITINEANIILSNKGTISISLDLGITKETITIESNTVKIREQSIPIEEIRKIKEETCYVLENNIINKASFFSEDTNRLYKLIPTTDWPTFAISAVPMHRHTHISPKEDTLLKIKEISPIKGTVLDTCTGMGYTAIEASRQADKVYTFERDKNVLYLASFNPYSRELFNNKKIEQREEDIAEGIKKFKDNFFDRIIHDPPTFKISPELYSVRFYPELYRVLKKGGILYHYAPLPHKMKEKEFYRSIMRKLKEEGFKNVEYHEASSGVVATK